MATYLVTKFTAFLKSKKIEYSFDDDGDIQFEYQGLKFIFFCNNIDSLPYFHLAQFGSLRAQRGSVSQTACAIITQDIKLLKAFVSENKNVIFSVEAFIPQGTPHVNSLFERFLEILVIAKTEYKKALKKIQNESGDDDELPFEAEDNLEDEDVSSDSEHKLPDPEGMELEAYCELVSHSA